MSIDWSPFVAAVGRHRRFLLTTHVRPDPDGLGSMLGLAEVLETLGKDVRMTISSVWPPRYDFLDPDKRIRRFEPPGTAWQDAEVVVVLDTCTWGQLGDFGPFLKTLAVPKFALDHHVSFDDIGAVRLVDTSAEATGRLVFEAVLALGATLGPRAADFLFAALATDTGWFRHRNTTAATFELAGKLVAAGAQTTRLFEQLYERNTLARQHLTGRVLDRLRVVEEGQVACTFLRRADYAQTGAVPSDSEDMINYARSIEGVEVAVVFMEQPDGGIKVSFRAREKVDVARVAESFGGGGHKLAAGAILQDSLEDAQEKVLDAIRKALE